MIEQWPVDSDEVADAEVESALLHMFGYVVAILGQLAELTADADPGNIRVEHARAHVAKN